MALDDLEDEMEEERISDPEILLEFRAGKMFTVGTRVVPDTRRGLIRITKGSQGLINFQWLDRNLNIPEFDQEIFPDEAIFEKVAQSSDRVYVLKFSTEDDNRKFFFWMQEPRADVDSHLCNAVNCFISRPSEDEEDEAELPMQMSETSEDAADNDLSSRAGKLVDQNTAGELTGEVSSSPGPVQLADLQRILSSIQTAVDVEDHYGALGLGDILKPDLVYPLIETLPLEQQLASYLPEGSWTPNEIMELLQSSPFRQQLDLFTHVLRTGQVDLVQFGIDPSKYRFTVLSFLEALDDSVAKVSEDSEPDGRTDLESNRCSRDGMDES